jgi:hypothetical protein
MRGLGAAVALLASLAAPAAARADDASLYRGPAPRPGPDILYAAPAAAPQLTNAGPWRAAPILVSGASAYRDGEFLYQDFLYDDHGARVLRDPGDPRADQDTFSQPNGTYTYPSDPVYADNAADLVELRVRPLAGATAFRLTLNSMLDPERVAATIAIGSSAVPMPFPHGANATAPAAMFLTVHGGSADLLDAVTGQPVRGGAPVASVDRERRQLEVRVPTTAWDPGASTVRLAAGVGLWDPAAGAYVVPGPARTAARPGGGTGAGTAFFNVAFRFDEPLPEVTNAALTATDPSWWRDRRQGDALRTGDLSPFHADVDFGKLAAGATDESGVPRTGVLDRILASHFETGQGTDFNTECGTSAGCAGELRGRLQPYALYVPAKAPAGGRYGLQLLLHSLGANYNQFSGSRNQSQFGERGSGHLVMTPAGRGPDGWYYDLAGADTFEVWADVARHYPLDPAIASVAGYSMGGYGTYKLATQFPDLFAKGQPTVGPPGLGIWLPPSPPVPGGERSLTFRQLGSLRNVPFLIWNAAGDQLVPLPGPQRQAQGFDELGYRYEFDVFAPAEHLTLAVHDQYAPAAAFLGDAAVDRDPAHITYVRNPTMDFPAAGTTADHAYWLSGIALRSGGGDAPLGSVDARSEGFGVGDPAPGPTRRGGGSLAGGTFGAIPYTSQARDWGPAPATPRADALTVTARNVGTVTVHPERARLTCAARLTVDTDGPVQVIFAGCSRTERFAAAGRFGRACARAAGFRRAAVRPRGRGVRITFTRRARRSVRVDVLRHSRGATVLGARRVKRFAARSRSFTWTGGGAGPGYYTVRLRMRLAGGAVDERRFVLERRGRRFVRRPAYVRRPDCAAVAAFRLNAPVFGGTTGRRLRIVYRLTRAARVRVDLMRGGRRVRRLARTQRVRAGRTVRLAVRPRGLPRGTYRVRLTIRRGGARTRRPALTARRL